MDISLVVAAYNEEPVIRDNLRLMIEALSARSGIDWEIVCVDDGSTDQTGAIFDEYATTDQRVIAIHHRRNFGQGRALRNAFDQCKGEVIVTVDADLSYGPEYIYLLVDVLKEQNVEIALASAYMKEGSVKNVPFIRFLLSRLGNYYLAKLSHYSISTSTCVVRAYNREVIDSIVLLSDGMELQLEILMKSYLMGFRVTEIPAHLEWAKDKPKNTGGVRRSSKMRILRTIRMYLTIGWLFKPAMAFVIISLLLLACGSYLLFNNILRYVLLVIEHMESGLINSLSISLKELIVHYPHTVVFCTIFMLFGSLTFAFALLLMQNKFYYEELFRLGQAVCMRIPKK